MPHWIKRTFYRVLTRELTHDQQRDVEFLAGLDVYKFSKAVRYEAARVAYQENRGKENDLVGHIKATHPGVTASFGGSLFHYLIDRISDLIERRIPVFVLLIPLLISVGLNNYLWGCVERGCYLTQSRLSIGKVDRDGTNDLQDIPRPPNSVIMRAANQGEQPDIFYHVDDAYRVYESRIENIVKYYQEEMPKRGWEQEKEQERGTHIELHFTRSAGDVKQDAVVAISRSPYGAIDIFGRNYAGAPNAVGQVYISTRIRK